MVDQQTSMTLDVKVAVEGVVAVITGIVTEIETTVTVIEIGQDVDTLLAEDQDHHHDVDQEVVPDRHGITDAHRLDRQDEEVFLHAAARDPDQEVRVID